MKTREYIYLQDENGFFHFGDELVRCKDCKFGSENGKYGCLLHRTHDGIMGTMKTMLADDFCSFGERKEE